VVTGRTAAIRGGEVTAFVPSPNSAPPPGKPRHGDPLDAIIARVAVLRGRLVIWDTDLADLYGLTRTLLVDSVCLAKPLPGDFWFQPEREEVSEQGRDVREKEAPRFVFTEHGAFVCAQYIGTPEAARQAVLIVRAFVRLRDRNPR
jgi:hypothetical protein